MYRTRACAGADTSFGAWPCGQCPLTHCRRVIVRTHGSRKVRSSLPCAVPLKWLCAWRCTRGAAQMQVRGPAIQHGQHGQPRRWLRCSAKQQQRRPTPHHTTLVQHQCQGLPSQMQRAPGQATGMTAASGRIIAPLHTKPHHTMVWPHHTAGAVPSRPVCSATAFSWPPAAPAWR